MSIYKHSTNWFLGGDEFIASCSEINYKDIARNPEDYEGQYFYAVVYVSSARQGGFFTGYQKYYISYIFDTAQADEYIGYGWYDSYSDAGFGAVDSDKSIWLLDNRDESDPDYVTIIMGARNFFYLCSELSAFITDRERDHFRFLRLGTLIFCIC